MRNPSKNTIKRLMRQAKEQKTKGRGHPPRHFYDQYHFFRIIGGMALFNMSKGKINSIKLTGIEKYIK